MKKLLIAGIAALLLAGCVPLYVPPVPESAALPSDVRIVHIAPEDGHLTVGLFGDIDGWLAAQWFAPTGRELGSHSVWLRAEHEAIAAQFPDVAPDAAYIVFSYDEHILRVFHK